MADITGASSGIGEATARALHADRHRVALLARRRDRIHALADELGNGAIAIEADVTDRDSITAAAERVHQELGPASILVNNAGVMLLAPFSSQRSEEHRRMVETNLIGAITATEVFLEQLREGGGDIVNISSVAGRTAPAELRRQQRFVFGCVRHVFGLVCQTRHQKRHKYLQIAKPPRGFEPRTPSLRGLSPCRRKSRRVVRSGVSTRISGDGDGGRGPRRAPK